MQNHFRLKLLVASIALAATASVCATPASNVSNAFVALATQQVNALRNGDVSTGPLAVSQPMHIVVSLKLRNKDQLDSFVAKAEQPGTPVAQRSMSPAQFAAQYSPTQAQAQAVADYLTKAGYKNVTIAPNRLLVEGDATSDTVRATFNTTFESVRTHDGRNAYHNTSAVMIPAALQDTVQTVLGLDNVHLSHTFAVRAHTNAAHPLATGTAAGHNPLDFPKIYGASSLPTASTVTVGNIVSGQMSDVLSDVKSFESTNGLPSLVPSIEGTGNTGSVSASGDGEWDLDTQDILAMTGGVKSLILYDAASLSDAALTTDYNLAVTDDKAVVINVSLGECETDAKSAGTTTAEDTVFEQAVAQGQTFSVSAGDSGANECTSGITPSWPASSQYVISAGGTEVYTTGTTWDSETVWNNLSESEGATGGSPSTFEPIPSWQVGVGQNGTSKFRGVPDIAYDASPDSGALVIVDGQANQQIGGTSLASPLFVGAWARIQGANGGALGFAAPLVYKAAAANYAADFHDITSGNNDGETAAVGWDYTTGFGSIIVSSLSSNISGGGGSTGGTPVANFSDTTSGLTATFTDSSTDSGGTISTHAWTFGDGSTSAVASPSHTYAAAGTYSVTETVTDSVSGTTSSKTASVTVSSSGGGTPTQILVNTGFETGTASPWTLSSGVLCSTSSSSSSYCGSGETSHAGTWFAWLDGYGASHTDTASQSVAIPSGKTTATLQYYLHIDSTKSTAADTLTVQVLNSSGTVLKTLSTFTSLNTNTGYAVETANLAAYIGQTVTIKFTGKETSSSGNTDFTLDDVTLTVQ
ncbi:protease pro-enzyme activation domain-containing protein [Rhodanobacter sp. A1T4]|uniref:protease pro-enzyme activation domain-containing protein n=1 Tax=Rhodanobacter sp. A1T4 TaxID=2723087 RepID=UPI0016170F96|nr:protease pro-enzyme activation domain-containing protein [Rhodanobacter sp. A1T4]MBB6248121.1 subtilase family serine protease [Rhodanobacter sp. A1T4]